MPAIIVFLIAAASFAGYSAFSATEPSGQASIIDQLLGQTPRIIQEKVDSVSEQAESVVNQVKPTHSTPVKTVATTRVPTQPIEKEPAVFVDTYIYSTFSNGKVFDETNEVALKFKAIIAPEDTTGNIYYEVKVLDYDTEWKRITSDKITLTLPYKSTDYIVLVRAGINEFIDETPAQKTFKINVSPYFEKVTFSGVSISNTSPTRFTLKSNFNDGEIDITGWEIKGERMGSFIIPKGIEAYPAQSQAVSSDIIIKPKDTIYIFGEENPLGGTNRNFKENKCAGYLNITNDFPISLSGGCPGPSSDEISYLKPCCQKYINRIGSCSLPSESEIKKYGLLEDPQCTDYLYSTFGYNNCFARYSQDSDFLRNTWHIFIGRDFKVTSACYDIYIYDQNGLVVDKYHYGTDYCGDIRL